VDDVPIGVLGKYTEMDFALKGGSGRAGYGGLAEAKPKAIVRVLESSGDYFLWICSKMPSQSSGGGASW
jgi:hypothetical protein